MLLKSVKYKNFRPFIGEQEIILDAPKGKEDANVTVILGDNTFGKSTFVLSFIWCLYGENRFTKPDILNKKVEESMTFGQQQTASVEVVFEDDGKVYTMRRTQTFTMGQNGNLNEQPSTAAFTYIDEKGEPKKVGTLQNDISLAMRAILPIDLSSFFFFEGEKNNEISRKDLGKSVRTLLGLEAFEKMRSHLHGPAGQAPSSASVMGYYLGKQSECSGDKAKQYQKDKEEAESKREEVIKRISELEQTILDYENKIDGINETLRQAAPSKELQKRRDAIKKELDSLENKLAQSNKRFLNSFGRDAFPLFIMPFLDKVLKRLNEMDVADKGIKGIEAPAIHELLNRGVCLCGTDLKPGTVAYKSVEKYIEYLPPKSVGTLVRDMMETIDANSPKCTAFVEDFEQNYKDIQAIHAQIDLLEREEREKLAEISKIGNVDTTDAEANLSSYKKRIAEAREERDRKNSEKTRLESEIETATRHINEEAQKNSEAQKYKEYYNYAQALYDWVNENYSEKEKAMRTRLNEHVTNLFNNMYSGHRDIQIDDKYNINMTVDGKIVDDTGGLRVIQYFAYVGGLVKLAYEVMLEREKDDEGNVEKLGEQYPLVLDAAFSHADEKHTRNIAKELAGATSQLIFALMHKDWTHAKEGLAGKVARMYELKKIDETEVQILEVK